jgi:hypothetical protein
MAFVHSPKIVTNGLVLALDAGNTKSYPGTGTTWFDKSGRGNNGTLTNGPTFDSGNGGSIVFDGVDDYVAQGTTFVNTGDSFTFAVWFKAGTQTSSAGSILRPFIIQGGSNAAIVVEISLVREGSVDHGKVRFRVGDGTSNQSSQTYNDQNWHYAVGTSTGSNTYLFIDGVLVSTGIPGNVSSPFGVAIGGDPYLNNSRWLVGSIATAQIYNRALSASEVLQNYNATKGRFGL